MGRTTTPKYIVIDQKKRLVGVWNRKTDGAPSIKNLEKYRQGFNDSLKPGQANAHLGQKYFVCSISIKNQWTGREVLTLAGPAFEKI